MNKSERNGGDGNQDNSLHLEIECKVEKNDLKNELSRIITKCIPNLTISGFIGDVHLVSHGKVKNNENSKQKTRRNQFRVVTAIYTS